MGLFSRFCVQARRFTAEAASLFELRRTSRFAHHAILGLRVRRQRGGAFAERALHRRRSGQVLRANGGMV
jgi:hypothetical protein